MKAIIVEDEYPARKELRYFIENNSNIEVINEFSNGLDVLEFIQENLVDVIFLDINIPKLDGMLLAKTINKFSKKPKIVFITAYEKYAVDAFSVEAFDYILKPYSEDRIIMMLKKLENIKEDTNKEERISEIKNKISLWKNNKIYVVDVEDIYYCQAQERYTYVYTEKDQFILRESISEVEKTINSKYFFKSHRSYLVNLTKIEEIVPWFNNTYILKLKGGEFEVTVSRSKMKEFKELMNL
ncbi:LytR/AlgR family response regulator transcription factor [Asaccharospora irregularis]|uniref:Stage 0 sporulation protein A homolog n=1 Tax=Asaccharospora irregularis DSM 2635 TaxID=1121321 RepID=A0A1M5JSQ8_9FIRM|nr:LytTR family DNA-binding domain-containing protein [Asaccharospora irregularis]SHG43574.1 two component transcriptional regulator, LytTR family [Asaccharospora irregularis DSM 2635]